jgi:hypothetical protein
LDANDTVGDAGIPQALRQSCDFVYDDELRQEMKYGDAGD